MALKRTCVSRAAVAMLLLVGGSAGTAFAQEATTPPGETDTENVQPFTLSGEVALVSDYRFRGVSLSDEEIALQPGLTLTHESGLYVGVWGSNVQEIEGGADIEVDLLAGYSTEFDNGLGLDVGLTYYLYPGDNDFNYIESHATLSYSAGPVTPSIGIAYAPKQDNLGDDDNFYVFGGLEGEIPGTPLTLAATLGYETGAIDYNDDGGKLDWSLGVSYAIGGFTAGLTYIDTDVRAIGGESGTRNLGDATVVASLKFEF